MRNIAHAYEPPPPSPLPLSCSQTHTVSLYCYYPPEGGLENLKMHRLERQAKASRVKADRIAKMTKRKAARDAQLAANKGDVGGADGGDFSTPPYFT